MPSNSSDEQKVKFYETNDSDWAIQHKLLLHLSLNHPLRRKLKWNVVRTWKLQNYWIISSKTGFSSLFPLFCFTLSSFPLILLIFIVKGLHYLLLTTIIHFQVSPSSSFNIFSLIAALKVSEWQSVMCRNDHQPWPVIGLLIIFKVLLSTASHVERQKRVTVTKKELDNGTDTLLMTCGSKWIEWMKRIDAT